MCRFGHPSRPKALLGLLLVLFAVPVLAVHYWSYRRDGWIDEQLARTV